MTEITNVDLPHDLVLKAISHARVIAVKNRNTHTDNAIRCVTGDEVLIKIHMGGAASVDAETTVGCCFFKGCTRGIYLRSGESKYNTVKTYCHELAHAFTNPIVHHGYPWRSLYFLFWATIPRMFDIYETESDFYSEVVDTLSRYELRGMTQYSRHVKAMMRMRTWYVDRVESQNS